ncbi:MAG TPA: hypothetical protein VF104_00880, partial [Burkholderiales bacterium]
VRCEHRKPALQLDRIGGQAAAELHHPHGEISEPIITTEALRHRENQSRTRNKMRGAIPG